MSGLTGSMTTGLADGLYVVRCGGAGPCVGVLQQRSTSAAAPPVTWPAVW